jgi:uncharacterized protein (DUF885 family)
MDVIMSVMTRLSSAVFAGSLLVLMGCAQTAPPPVGNTSNTSNTGEAGKLHALFEAAWEEGTRQFPEWATYRGDHRYGDRLADMSAPAIAARDEQTKQRLAQAQAIDRAALNTTDRVSLDMFIDNLQRQLEVLAFPGWRTMNLRALGGPHTQFADLLAASPVNTRAQMEQMLARMAAYPQRIDQEIAQLRGGLQSGWVSSKDVLQRVLTQIDGQLPADVAASPYYLPFTRMGRDIPAAEQTALQQRARELITTRVNPAMQKLRAFVANEYLPKAPADGALLRQPEGQRVYAMLVRHRTTTARTPDDIHALGLRELARIRTDMQAVQRELKFEGSFVQFVQHLNTDPKYFHKSPDDLLAGYREISKRLDAEMPKLFAELPRMPYGVSPMPPHMGSNRAEYYNGPALDGSRAGMFFANILAYKRRPIWGMETLVAHEAMPGHHLQIARSMEQKGLPSFRRSGFGYTAFSEGWALYAETLGFELGLYKQPESRFGHLQWQAFRAARLVVDTGIHAKGWGRQQAIDFMVDQTGVDRGFVEGEIDRYTSEPAQALAYMIGKLKFDELRDRAKQQLGAKFDIRKFHNAVLDQGALPLDVLDKAVDEWIVTQAARH